jgi:hypothetical protein
MSLKNINDNLYEPESHIELRGHKKSRFDPEMAKKGDELEFAEEKEWPEPRRGFTDFQKKVARYVAIGLAIVFVVSAGITVVYRIVKSSYEKQKMTIEISGPQEVNSAQEVEYKINYQNRNWLRFNDVEIYLNHSDNFQITQSGLFEKLDSNTNKLTVGKVSAGEKGELKIKGKFFAPEDFIVYMQVTVKYTPLFFSNSRFETHYQIPVSVKSAPIKIDIEAPGQAADGQLINYYIHYENSSDASYPAAEIRINYPDDFDFHQSKPESSDSGKVFRLGTLAPGQRGMLFIEGIFNGKMNDNKSITVMAGNVGSDNNFVEFVKQEKNTQVTGSPLMVTQSIVNRLKSDNSVNAGETLYYKIYYKNLGSIGLRDVIINFYFNEKIIDYSMLRLAKGSFSGADKRITWKAVDYPALANLGPGESGEILFNVMISKNIPVANDDDSNFSIKSTVNIDSPDVPTPVDSNKIISSDTLNLRLNSPVFLELKALYYDDKISNTGPLPPKVGEETTYTIHWKITNISNNLSNVKVTSSLPTSIKWKNVIAPKGENIYFNERTNQLIWEVGKVDHGAGIINPAREVIFQVGLVPQIYDSRMRPTLVNDALLTGIDMFTDQSLNIKAASKNIELRDDPKTDQTDFSVE